MNDIWIVGVNDEGDRVAISASAIDRMWTAADGRIEGTFVSHVACGVALVDSKTIAIARTEHAIAWLVGGGA